jgi:hypothetical protein
VLGEGIVTESRVARVENSRRMIEDIVRWQIQTWL